MKTGAIILAGGTSILRDSLWLRLRRFLEIVTYLSNPLGFCQDSYPRLDKSVTVQSQTGRAPTGGLSQCQ